jgi:hypothetical protein
VQVSFSASLLSIMCSCGQLSLSFSFTPRHLTPLAVKRPQKVGNQYLLHPLIAPLTIA